MTQGQAPVLWRISSWSNGTNCIEVASQNKSVQIRDSQDRDGRTLSVPALTWHAFIEGVRRNVTS
jgi:Domain of unknown function (DUF397)